jgi:N-acetylneuraminic acid mutarotase
MFQQKRVTMQMLSSWRTGKLTSLLTLLLFLAVVSPRLAAQANEWTWMGGSILQWPYGYEWGNYGTKGVPAAGNVPAARNLPVSWTDSSGNLWLFGGNGLNDLWKYTPSTGEWTWMSGGGNHGGQPGVYGTLGVPAAGNVPGGRVGAVGWTDASGNLWLFGGQGNDAGGSWGELNDLWKYTRSTGEWTWMSGSNTVNQPSVYGTLGVPAAGNVPGARNQLVSATDASGNFWLFGGQDQNGNDWNDLWKYTPSTGEWTWMSGSNTVNQPGVYGRKGVPAAGNVPGARYEAASWTDLRGNLWLFGGEGYDGYGTAGQLNDLWRYAPSTGEWTMMSGSNVANQSGVRGPLGVPSASNVPGARASAVGWTDSSGNLWLFGGWNPTFFSFIFNDVNDLWRYTPSTGEWTWMSGSSSQNQLGVYGTLGVPAAGNVPGARLASAVWTDASGNLWLFGGASDALEWDARYDLNDFWKYTLTPAIPFSLSSSLNPAPMDQNITLTAQVYPAPASAHIVFYDHDTVLGTVALAEGSASLDVSTLLPGRHDVGAAYTDGNGTHISPLLVQSVQFPSETITLTSSMNPAAQGQTVTLTTTMAPAWPGTVYFYDGNTLLGSAALSGGTASLSTSALMPGVHRVGAVYVIDGTLIYAPLLLQNITAP